MASTRRLVVGLVLASVLALLLQTSALAVGPAPSNLRNYQNALCVDDTNWSTSQGTQMQQWPCTGNSNQVWTEIIYSCPWGGQYGGNCALLQNRYSGLCLDVKGRSKANFTPAIQWGCSPVDIAQVFKVMPAPGTAGPPNWVLVSDVGTCLDDPGQSTNSGTKLEFYQCNQTVAQIWVGQGWIGVWP